VSGPSLSWRSLLPGDGDYLDSGKWVKINLPGQSKFNADTGVFTTTGTTIFR
jgi:hypothetical protein